MIDEFLTHLKNKKGTKKGKAETREAKNEKEKITNGKKSKKNKRPQTKRYNSRNFMSLKQEIFNKENYKIEKQLKIFYLQLGKNKIKKNDSTINDRNEIKHNNVIENLTNQKKDNDENYVDVNEKENFSKYTFLIRIDVKMVITTYFYAYIVYLNEKGETFKSYLGKYKIKFNDFFFPFKAKRIYWKYIFEDLWKNKISTMYASTKYLRFLSSHVSRVINDKLLPFVIKEKPNIEEWNVSNYGHYKMFNEKSYDMTERYNVCSCIKKKKGKKKEHIFRSMNTQVPDEYFIDGYSLYSSSTKSSTYRNTKCKNKTKKWNYTTFKPRYIKEVTNESVMKRKDFHSIKTTEQMIRNEKRIRWKIEVKRKLGMICTNQHMHIKDLEKRTLPLELRKTRPCKSSIGADNKNNEKGYRWKQMKLNRRHKNKLKFFNYIQRSTISSKISKNESRENHQQNIKEHDDEAIEKYVGIFLPPKYHLLFVFHIFKTSTIVQIRTDNLNVLNYLNPFFKEYFG